MCVSLLFALAVVSGALAFGGLVSSCSGGGSTARMSEADTLSYKRGVIVANQSALTPAQVTLIMYHPARTQAEIDAYLEKLKLESATEKAAAEARLKASKEASGTSGE